MSLHCLAYFRQQTNTNLTNEILCTKKVTPRRLRKVIVMNSMQTCNSVTFYLISFHEKSHFLILAGSAFDQNMTPESIHTKDESKRGFAFAFIFGVN